MRPSDRTPYDGECCEHCGTLVERDIPLCDDCAERAEERRRAARAVVESERRAAA